MQTGVVSSTPPAVNSAVACEASFAKGVGFVQNPGETEWITFSNPSESSGYNIFFAVAGTVVDGTSGAFDVEVNQVTSKPYCRNPFPASSIRSGP